MSEKRVAVVTGGTRGMGRDISLELARRGNIVAAVYHSNEKAAKETLEDLRAIEPACLTIQADVSYAEGAEKVMGIVDEKFGRLDILVNNAGIFTYSYLEDMTEEFLMNIMRINFFSDFHMTKAAVPLMKRNMYGRICNASSISSWFADCGLIGYGCSKGSVDMLTKISSAELAPYGILVNAYAPGITHTDMTHELITDRGDSLAEQISLNRYSSGKEVASLVGYLTSEENTYVTGDIIGVDGGMLKVQNPHSAYEYAKSRGDI